MSRITFVRNLWQLPLKDQQQAVNTWLNEHFCEAKAGAVFFTLKFYNVIPSKKDGDTSGESTRMQVSGQVAEAIVNRFLQALDREFFFDRHIDQGRRLRRAVFRHMGVESNNVHFHGVILIDGDAQALANKCWKVLRKMNLKNIDVNSCYFEVAKNTRQAALYAAKEVHRIGSDTSWMVNQSHISDKYSQRQQALDKALIDEKTKKLREQRLAMETERGLLVEQKIS